MMRRSQRLIEASHNSSSSHLSSPPVRASSDPVSRAHCRTKPRRVFSTQGGEEDADSGSSAQESAPSSTRTTDVRRPVTRNRRRQLELPRPTPPSPSAQSQLHIATRILGSKRVRGVPHFQVEWDGYPASEATWEPLENVRDSIAYRTFVFGTSVTSPSSDDSVSHARPPAHSMQVTLTHDSRHDYSDEQTQSDAHVRAAEVDVALYADTTATHEDDTRAPSTTTSSHVTSPGICNSRDATHDTTHTPTFLCPNELCGVYVCARNFLHHINTYHVGSLLSRDAAATLGVTTCAHCSKHFRQIGRHRCAVRHLTPIKHKPTHQRTLTPLITVTTMSDALTEQLAIEADADADADADGHKAVATSLEDHQLAQQQRDSLLSRVSADGTTRHIVDVLADGDCLYRAICVCWDIPQTQHYQLRERVAEHLMQLAVDDFKELCQQYDNIAQALQTATKHRIGQDSLVTDSATQQQVDTLSMDQWSDNTWINIRNMYIQHVVLHRSRYGGLLDIQALCDSHLRNINVHLASDIMRGKFSPLSLQPPPDTIDDSGAEDDIALLHVKWDDVSAEGNHFDIICAAHVHDEVRLRLGTHTHTLVTNTETAASTTSSHDVSTNTDATMQPLDTTTRVIPVLLPLSLPPSYRHMPVMWRLIPSTAKHSWVSLCSIYLQRAWVAHKRNDIDTRDRALVAFMLLPRRALCRSAGQRSARYKLKRKLQQQIQQSRTTPTAITVDGDDSQEANTHSRRASTSALTKSVNRAAELMRAGHISRAAATITQTEPVPLTPSVIDQLQQLHPAAGAPMSQCPDDAPMLYLSGKDLATHVHVFRDNGAAPGPSGWTGDLIQPLLNNSRCLDAIAMLLMLIINGDARGQLCHMLQAMRGMPLAKPQSTKVRPIDMGEVWVKAAGRIVMKQVDVARVFPTIQYGSAVRGGCEKALHIIQTQLEKHMHDDASDAYSSTVAISTDIANAFNTCSRAHIFSNMQGNDHTHPLLRMFHWSHSSPSHVLVYDHDNGSTVAAVIASAAGTKQGDLLASLGYNISMQPTYCAVQALVPEVTLVAIHDDLTIVGPLKHALRAFDCFAQLLQERGDLKLQPAKCRLLSPSLSAPCHTAIRQECESRSLTFLSGCMSLLGSYVGADDTTATAIVKDVVESCYPLLDALTHINMPSPFAMLLLRHCITSKVAYLTRVTRPEVTRMALLQLDKRILTTLATKLHLPPPDALSTTTVSLIRLPVSLGGLGLASAADSAPAAFLASVCLSLPHVTIQPQAPYAVSLARAHATVLTPGTGVVASDKLPSTVEALLTTYSQPTPLVDGLQHHIQLQASKHIQRAILASYTSNAQRAALLSASAPHAGTPSTSIPSVDNPGLVMPSAQFDQYVRMRLQLPPRDIVTATCNVLQCGAGLPDDIARTHHHQVCKHIRSREATLRHNTVLTTVLRYVRDAGFAAAHEEPVRDDKGHKLRPDAIITPCSPQYPVMYIDVSVTHPAAQSYNTQAANVTNPLYAATQRERIKHAKYDPVAAQDSARFIPLVLESYGAFGKEFDAFLSMLGSAAADFHGFSVRELRDWIAAAYRDISVALHSGNALMAMRTIRATSFVEAR